MIIVLFNLEILILYRLILTLLIIIMFMVNVNIVSPQLFLFNILVFMGEILVSTIEFIHLGHGSVHEY